MKVIILAAGFGRRLGQFKSKGLVELDGQQTFFDKQFQALEQFGMADDVVLVAGKDFDNVRARYHHRCVEVIHNVNVDLNNGHSLFLAASHMQKGFLLINCDVVFEPSILKSLVDAPDANTLMVDGAKGLDPEEMKACAIHGIPYRLKKKIIPHDVKNRIGEFAGMCKVTQTAAIPLLVEILEQRSRSGTPFYWEDALEDHMTTFRYGVAFTEGRKWVEVDFPADLSQAKEMFGFQ